MLVLSLFPGIGLLDMAFEQEGFCVVRGPDVLWGGDIRRFHPPAGKVDGVIGGPPCQAFSSAAMNMRREARNLIPEFVRCIVEAAPAWWLMENVRRAPTPIIEGYCTHQVLVNNRWFEDGEGIGAEQRRIRKFVFGTRDGRRLIVGGFAALESPVMELCVTATERSKGRPGRGPYSGRRPGRGVGRQCELMGLPTDFLDGTPFTEGGKGLMIGNAVPLPMGRAIARAVKEALTGPMVKAKKE